jgi:serine/threonine protein kinase
VVSRYNIRSVGAQTIDDRFVLEHEAASGGMGTVHRGRDLATGATVAIKLMRKAGVEVQLRFDREARILRSLTHPAIVRYVAHGIHDDGAPYLVMDWIDGVLLDQLMDRPGITVAQTIEVGRRVAGALGHAHAAGVVHRDVKPSNLIAPDGDLARLMVIDFGVARAMAAPGSLTETGAVVGTPAYMSPEQVRGERGIGPTTDVFALVCVLYSCLTGRVTFHGKRFLALRAKIIFWDPPPIRELAPEVPPELEELVMSMLSKSANRRPADGNAVLALLDALPPVVAEEPAPPRPRQQRAPRAEPRPGVAEAARLVSIIVVASPDSLEPTTVPEPGVQVDEEEPDEHLDRSLEDSMLGFGAAIDRMPDGTMIATLTDADNARAQARAAVRCAQTLRSRYPDALIGVATGEVRADEEADMVEDLVQQLAKDAMATMFSGVIETHIPPGAILLDERTAELVRDETPLLETRGASYVRPLDAER